MFLVLTTGVNLPIGSAEVAIVRESEVREFMANRKAEILTTSRSYSNEFANIQKQYDSASSNFNAMTKRRNDTISMLHTNDDYVDLKRRTDDAKRYYDDFKEKYKEQISDETKLKMRDTLSQLSHNYTVLQKELSEKDRATNNYFAYQTIILESTQRMFSTSLADAQLKCNSYPTAGDYLADFAPQKLESVLTSADGTFTVTPHGSCLVFAKVQTDDGPIFWLVKIPDHDEKLILSNQNAFKPKQL